MAEITDFAMERVRSSLVQQAKWARKFSRSPEERRAAEIWMEVIGDLEIEMHPEELAAVAESSPTQEEQS